MESVVGDDIFVLLVDDEPEFADLTATFLERESDRFAVEVTTTVDEGEDRLAETDVDCVVADYDIAARNGIDLLRTVRDEYGDLPFILYTGKGSEEVASEAISAGVTDYLQKRAGTERYELLANRIVNAVEQYRAQRRIEHRRRRLHALLEHSNDRIAVIDECGIYRFVSPAMERLMGYDPDELVGDSGLEYVHPDDRDRVRSQFERVIANPEETIRAEYRYRRDDGSWRWVESHAKNRLDDPAIEGIVINSRDVTAQKRHERELQRERDLFVTLFENLPNPVVYGEVCDDGPVVKQANRAFEEVFGFDVDEIVGENVDELTVPEGRREEATALNERFLDHGRLKTEVTRRTDDGLRDFVLNTVARKDGGEPREGYAIYTDITERKERERELRETTQKLQAVLDTVSAAIIVKDVDGRYLLMNDDCREIIGIDADEDVTELTDDDLFPAVVAERFRAEDRRVLETGETLEIEKEVPTGNGVQTHLTRKSPILDEDGEPYAICAVSTDISDRIERERELERQNERLEEFASIVSHDLRNPLSVAEGRLDLVREECASPHLEDLEGALDRMESLIEELLTLAREGSRAADVEPVDLKRVAERCWESVDAPDATLRIDTDRRIEADEGRLRQLLENLFRNAVEHGAPDVTVAVGDLEAGFYVEDDGPGIPPEARELVFESGYSTARDGTGLGLRIVDQVADAHGWETRVTDGPDGGARFEVDGVEVVDG